ncbi:amidohydrolase family protein [Gemmata sp. JC717]|uniref:Amidohydrolase n=1 Tax=Gemmata algarum TaxID=2975278 RepID=A0ABU5F684_9BACT|nr:amidohydrolase family protein [Gemmata algarum]MDY3556573.1 amidohydrolase family protein [Gemmata algarum]MDY3563062.1 amidohydrolase [Gemmata algarum]
MIDVHIHAVPPNLPGVGSLAPLLREAPEVIATQLRREMQTAGVTDVFAMGAWTEDDSDPLGINGTLEVAPFVPGLRPIGVMDPTRDTPEHFRRVEAVLASGVVVALKGYLGYLHFEPAHPSYQRYYELAARYRVPVMFHTGDTYSPQAKLRYAHPLGVDEVAVDHPDCRFLICHLGNPWMTDAAEVIYKNVNVWADLSGLMIGDDSYLASEEGREAAYELAQNIRKAIKYSERPNRFVYGTDWPLAPMTAYREFVKTCVPADNHEQVFLDNARLLFRLG